jgi:hypothetical protein
MKRTALSLLLVFACQGQAPTIGDTAAPLGQFPRPNLPLPPRAQPMTGTITVWGCSPLPSEMKLYLATTVGLVPDANGNIPPPPTADEDGNDLSRMRGARIDARQDPHVYSFRIEAVKTGKVYRMGIAMNSSRCPKTVWRGPQRGYVFGGDPRPINIEGFAMRTQTEVLATRGQNSIWVGVDRLDFDPQSSQRILRWRTNVPGAVAGQVQIAAKRFPVGGSQQNSPPLLASFNVPLNPQGWSQLPPIDFNQVIQTQCDPQNPNQCTPGLGTLGLEVRSGLPLYVRVVPVDGSGTMPEGVEAGIPSHVKLAHVSFGDVAAPPPPAAVPPLGFQIWSDVGQPEKELPYSAKCYVVTDTHHLNSDVASSIFSDPWGFMAVVAGGATPGTDLAPGFFFCIHSGGGGFLDDVFDAVSGFFDALADAVDYVAKLYEEIKEKVVSVLTDLAGDLGCPSDVCGPLVEYAVDSGLAAMGLPPSLPDWNQLVDEGFDYLAEEASEEVGGYVDKDTMKAFMHEVVDTMKKSRGSVAPWLTEDDGFRAPILHVAVAKNAAYTGTTPTLLHIPSQQYYLGSDVVLPARLLDDGGFVHVPVQMLPNLSSLAPPPGSCLCLSGSAACFTGTPGCACSSPFACFPSDSSLARLFIEDEWFYGLYTPTACTAVTADARVRVVDPSAGTAFTTEYLGTQIDMTWATATPPGYYDFLRDPFAHACTP